MRADELAAIPRVDQRTVSTLKAARIGTDCSSDIPLQSCPCREDIGTALFHPFGCRSGDLMQGTNPTERKDDVGRAGVGVVKKEA